MKGFSLLVIAVLVVALEARQKPWTKPMGSGHFTGSQAGDALTKVNSESDTSTGQTRTGVKGMLANSGKLRGASDAAGPFGGTRGSYAGDMSGNGGMWADTQSQSGPGGPSSKTALKGFLNDGGSLSGSVGGGSSD